MADVVYYRPCETCGGPCGVTVRSIQAGHPQRFCERKCWRVWVRRDLDTRTCAQCPKTFEVRRASKQRFCSIKCSDQAQIIPLADRLWPRLIHESAERAPGLGPCWIWSGTKNNSTGYGYLSVRENGKRRHIDIHRLAFELTFDPIPPDLVICHQCDVRLCGNPDHLFLGTQLVNMRDMAGKGRGAVGDRNGSRTHPERIPRGDRRSHLKNADIIAMRTRYAAGGVTHQQLADEYSTTRRNVGNIIQRRSWAHL